MAIMRVLVAVTLPRAPSSANTDTPYREVIIDHGVSNVGTEPQLLLTAGDLKIFFFEISARYWTTTHDCGLGFKKMKTQAASVSVGWEIMEVGTL